MNFDGKLLKLFSLSKELISAAYNEIVLSDVKCINSVVPGFSNGRSIIILRGTKNPPTEGNTLFGIDMINCFDFMPRSNMPIIFDIIDAVVMELDAKEVGMAVIAITQPGTSIFRHIDKGPYYDHYRRIHIALNNVEGSILEAGGLEVNILAGEVWELNNLIMHHARNDGSSPRYHLIIDLV